MTLTVEERRRRQYVAMRRYREAHREELREASRAYYAENREKYAANSRRWRQANPHKANAKQARYRQRHPETQLLKGARHRARRYGLPFSLSKEFVADLVAPMTCSVTGIPLRIATGRKGGPGQWSPSLDRIVPALGYVPGNVRLVCHSFNVVRQYMTDAEAAKLTLDRHENRLGGPLA